MSDMGGATYDYMTILLLFGDENIEDVYFLVIME